MVFIIFATYLFTSFSMANLVGAIKGVDLNQEGTKNPGATNVYKLAGPGWAVLTGVFDFLKGVVPVFIFWRVFNYPDWIIILVALTAICGHNWPLYYNFKGGRGLATSLGTMAVLAFYPAFISFVTGGILAWYFTNKLKREIRIPYITYPLYLILVILSGRNGLFIFYGTALMLIAYLRAWQIKNR